MLKLWTLIKNDIKLYIRDWKALLLLLGMPFLFIAFFTYGLSPLLERNSFIEPFSIAIADEENSPQMELLINQLEEIEFFREIVRTDRATAERLVTENKVAAALLIPAGFTRSVMTGENKPVTVIANPFMPLQSKIVKSLMTSAASLVSAAQGAINTIYHFNEKAGLTGKELDDEFKRSTISITMEALSRRTVLQESGKASGAGLTAAEHFTAALLVVFLMFAGMPGVKLLVQERSCGLALRLAVSPCRPWQVILSKFLVSIALSALQFSMIILSTSLAFNNYWGAPPGDILKVFGAVVFAVSAWSVLVSAISRTPAVADMIGNLGILLMAVLGGSIYPLATMPDFIRGISKFTINRWAIDGFSAVLSGNVSAAATPVWVLIGMGTLLLAVTGCIFKWVRYSR